MIHNLRSYHSAVLKQSTSSHVPVRRDVDVEEETLTSFKDDLQAMDESIDQTCHRLQFSRRWSDTSWGR